MSALNKYLAPVLQFVILVGAVVQTALADGLITGQESIQILAFAVAPAITFLVPLTSGPWPGILKTGLNAILGGLLVLLDILAAGGWQWSANLMILIGLAVINALAVELGVGVRTSEVKAALASPNVSNVVVVRSDPGAYSAVTHEGRHHLTS
jgi:hypothetical protein